MKYTKQLAVFTFAAFLLLLSACGLGAEAGRKPSPDWSRGIHLSDDIGGTVGMTVLGDGQSVHFVWPSMDAGQGRLDYVHIDGAGRLSDIHSLELPAGVFRSPRLLPAGGERMHLLYGWRQSGAQNWELRYVLLDAEGMLLVEPSVVSLPDTDVSDIVIAQGNNGGGAVVWEDDVNGGFMAARLTADGFGEAVRITNTGVSPTARLDAEGNLFLAWFERDGVYYARYPIGESQLVTGTLVADDEESPSLQREGPSLGLSEEWVTILWSIYARTGLESNTGWTSYVSFQKESPARSSSTRLWIWPDEEQTYQAYDGAYPLTVLATPPITPGFTTNYVLQPDAALGVGSEVAFALASKQESRLDEIVQMAVALFENGQYIGYQMAAKTESFSQDGTLVTDASGHLHLGWLEGTGNRLYYATTAPGIGDGINKLGRGDLFSALLGGGTEAVVGVLFFPLSLLWFIPGLIILGIWKLRHDDETLQELSSRVLLVIAMFLYQLTKVLFLPSVTSYVPFSAWFDISDGLGTVLRFAVPIASFGIGLLVADWLRRRKPETTAILYFFIACGIDTVFTLAIYGVNYLGVY